MTNSVGVLQPTAKSWAGVLEASYVAYLLPPWSRNYGKRVVKSPKLYLCDSGLAGLLTRQPDANAALAGPMGGALLEGWVIVEAVKAFMALGRRPDLYFWRSHDGLEVDLLIVINGKLQPVEIKLAATPSANHVEPLARFIDIAGGDAAGPGIVMSRMEEVRPLPKGHLAMPWHSFPDWLRERLARQ